MGAVVKRPASAIVGARFGYTKGVSVTVDLGGWWVDRDPLVYEGERSTRSRLGAEVRLG